MKIAWCKYNYAAVVDADGQVAKIGALKVKSFCVRFESVTLLNVIVLPPPKLISVSAPFWLMINWSCVQLVTP